MQSHCTVRVASYQANASSKISGSPPRHRLQSHITEGLNGVGWVRGAMVRVQVTAYAPTDFLEEADVTIGRCRELIEKFAVTWVNVVDPDARTLEELETLFGFHPLALEDAQNSDLASKVDVYEDVVFIVARTIVWAEEIDTDQLSLFVAKKFLVTIHDKVFPHLEDIRIRLRKKNPKMLKSGADFLAYTILDHLVDSYFPHLDRFQTLLDQLEEEIVEHPSGMGIARLHDMRTDIIRLRNGLRPQRDMFGLLGRLEIPVFRKETRTYLRDVQDHMISALDALDTNREIVASLMEVQATLASNQVNEVIKVLTVIFTITLPIVIVSSAFGMNVDFPGTTKPEGLYLALLLMALPTIAIVAWIRRKGWL
jgi:magnesium transporter